MNRSSKIALNLIQRAVVTNTGYLTSSELERPFLELAKTINTNSNTCFVKDSFLHVMTQCYVNGGHTRVVERWIEASSENQKHSVIVLEQGNVKCPQKLYDVTRLRNGELIFAHQSDIIKRAKFLRDIAVGYEYIILHIHMWDPTAIIAFGKSDFTRPVIFFNHADHDFWCGSSIVDMLADLRENNFAKIRGINNHFTLRIPFEPNREIASYCKSKIQSRVDLGLPLDKKIILTIGGSHKFSTFDGKDFCNIVIKAISDTPDVICVGVGPKQDTGNWNRYKGQFFAVGEIEYGTKYFDYLNACDIYINSIPIGGGTAILDAAQFHKPIVSYSIFKNPLGEIIKGVETLYNESIFIDTVRSLLKDGSLGNAYAKEQYDTIMRFHGIDSWINNLNKMVSVTPSTHVVNNGFFRGRRQIDDLNVLCSLWFNSFPSRKIDLHFLYHCIKCLCYNG